MATDHPSELEHVVLGIVWKEGPCTPHAIRTNFVTSRNSRFSGSQGAIYPLVRRMAEKNLLKAEESQRGNQARKLYRVTPDGRKVLRTWLSNASSDEDGVLHDPLRLRVYFLGALPPSKRERFFDAAEQSLVAHREALTAEAEHYRACESQYSVLATEGALAVCTAQLAWIRKVRTVLENDAPA